MDKLKTTLVLMIAAGAVALFAGNGTWASFSAETTNAGGSVSSGTLTMSNTVNAGTACLTINAPAGVNNNPSCAAPITLTNVAPGVFGGTSQIQVTNTGSLDASKLTLWAPFPNATLNGTLSTIGTTTSLPITPLEGAMPTPNRFTLPSARPTRRSAPTGPPRGGA